MILPALDDRVGEHPRAGQALRNRQVERLGDVDRRRRVTLAILAHELRPRDAHDDERRGPALDRLADFLSDALEGIEPLALDLGRKDLDVHARQILGDRSAPRRLVARVLGHFDRLGLGERGLDVPPLAIAEHHAEHRERELRVIRVMALRLRREDAALEHPATLHRLEVEPVVLVALAIDLRHSLLELFEPLRQRLLELGHGSLLIDARSRVNDKRS